MFLVPVVSLDWQFLVATRRDALDEPADLTIDRVDLLEILALFGLQRRMLLHHLAQKRVLLPLLLLLRLLSYQWLYVHLLQLEARDRGPIHLK